MKIAILLKSKPVLLSLKKCCETILGAQVIEDPEESDYVVCEEPRDMLRYLKHGKYVAQFLMQPTSEPMRGLQESFPDRFKVYGVIPVGSFGGVTDLWADMAEKEKEKKI